jgi:hypothetical protein
MERNNVWVLKSGDELSLDLEVADEVGIVGELGANDLDSNFSANTRLVRAMDNPERARSDLFPKFIAG